MVTIETKEITYFSCSLVIKGNRYNVTSDIGQHKEKNQLKEMGKVNTGKTSSGILQYPHQKIMFTWVMCPGLGREYGVEKDI